jgi:coenzyme Q-binding protein COQ10
MRPALLLPRAARGAAAAGAAAAARRAASFHAERRTLAFSRAHVFSVVAGVEHYRHFVPWCVDSVVTTRSAGALEADLAVGFGVLAARYSSRVALERAGGAPGGAPGGGGAWRVRAVASDTPLFDILENEWELAPGAAPGTTDLAFKVRWRFRSKLLGGAADLFRDEVARKMVAAFEARCGETAAAWAAEEAAAAACARAVKEARAAAEAAGAAPPAALPAPCRAAPRFPPPPPLPPGVW